MKKLFLILALLIIGGYLLIGSKLNLKQEATISPEPTIGKSGVSIVLSEEGRSGQTGLAYFSEKAGRVAVDVELVSPAFAPEPAGILEGDCKKLGKEAYNLTDVVNGSSQTELNINLDSLNRKLPLSVVVFSEEKNKTVVACGEIKR